MGAFSIWHWLIVLIIVLLIFGTKRLKNIGQDLGGAIKGFKEGIREADTPPPSANAANTPPKAVEAPASGEIIDVQPEKKETL